MNHAPQMPPDEEPSGTMPRHVHPYEKLYFSHELLEYFNQKIPQKVNDINNLLRLLENGANPNLRDSKTGETVLHRCVAAKKPIHLQLLLQWQANPLIVDHEGNTPLHTACQGGKRCIPFLINALPTPQHDFVNLLNKQGQTPLDVIPLNGKPHAKLLDAGARHAAELPESARSSLSAERAATCVQEAISDLNNLTAKLDTSIYDSVDAESVLRIVEQKMRCENDRLYLTGYWPPLLRYALDEDFLPGEVYETIKAQHQELCAKSYPLTYALFCVRKFHEHGSGRNAEIPFTFESNLKNHAHDYVWFRAVDEYLNSGNKYFCVGWMRAQCPILKRNDVKSELFAINTKLWEGTEIQQFIQQDWEILLGDEALSVNEKPALPQELQALGREHPYITFLWEHSWLDWLMMLKAMMTPPQLMPSNVPPRWAALRQLAGLVWRLDADMESEGGQESAPRPNAVQVQPAPRPALTTYALPLTHTEGNPEDFPKGEGPEESAACCDVEAGALAVHLRMKKEYDGMRESLYWPPLLRYALDEEYLPNSIYKAISAMSGEQYDRLHFWAYALYSVRRFYEEGKGNDPNFTPLFKRKLQKLSKGKLWLSDLRRFHCSENSSRPHVEWMRTQCPILKTEGKQSELRDFNTILWENPNIHQWLRHDWDNLLDEEWLASQPLPQLPTELREWAVIRPYIHALWEHSWLDWLLMLKAMVSDIQAMPDNLPPRWAWLNHVVGIAEAIKNEMKWCYFPSRRTIYLSCQWSKQLGENLLIEGGSIGRTPVSCGASYVWRAPLMEVLSLARQKSSGIAIGVEDTLLEGQHSRNEYFVFRLDRLNHAGIGHYELLPEEGSRRPAKLLLAYPRNRSKELPELVLRGDAEDRCIAVGAAWTENNMTYRKYELRYSSSTNTRQLLICRGGGEEILRWGSIEGKPRFGRLNLVNDSLRARPAASNEWMQVLAGPTPALQDAFMVEKINNARISLQPAAQDSAPAVLLWDGKPVAPDAPVIFRVNGNIPLLWLPEGWSAQARPCDVNTNWEVAQKRRCQQWLYEVDGQDVLIEGPLTVPAWFLVTGCKARPLPRELRADNIRANRDLRIHVYLPESSGEETAGAPGYLRLYYNSVLQKEVPCGANGVELASLLDNHYLTVGDNVELRGSLGEEREVMLLKGVYYPAYPVFYTRGGRLMLFEPNLYRCDYTLRLREVRRLGIADCEVTPLAEIFPEPAAAELDCASLIPPEKAGWYFLELVDCADEQVVAWEWLDASGMSAQAFVRENNRELAEAVPWLPAELAAAYAQENGKPFFSHDESGKLIIISQTSRMRTGYHLICQHEHTLLTPWPRPLPEHLCAAAKQFKLSMRKFWDRETLRIETLFTHEDEVGWYKLTLAEIGSERNPQVAWYRHGLAEDSRVIKRLKLEDDELRSLKRWAGDELEKHPERFCEILAVEEVRREVFLHCEKLEAQEEESQQEADSGVEEWRWCEESCFYPPLMPMRDDKNFTTKTLCMVKRGQLELQRFSYPNDWRLGGCAPDYDLSRRPLLWCPYVMYGEKRLGFLRRARGEQFIAVSLAHIGIILGYKTETADTVYKVKEFRIDDKDEDDRHLGELHLPIDTVWRRWGELQNVYTLITLRVHKGQPQKGRTLRLAWSQQNNGFGINIGEYAEQHPEFRYRIMLNCWDGYKFPEDSAPFLELKRLCNYPESWHERFCHILSYLAERCCNEVQTPSMLPETVRTRLLQLSQVSSNVWESIREHLSGFLDSLHDFTLPDKREELNRVLTPIAEEDVLARLQACVRALAICLILRNRICNCELRPEKYSHVIRPQLMDMALTQPAVRSLLNNVIALYNDFFI